jgi:adenylylsulfate kinase
MARIVWITDRPAAEAAAAAVRTRGEAVVLLDADRMRELLASGAPTVADRAVVQLALTLADAGVAVVLHGAAAPETPDLPGVAGPPSARVRAAAAAPAWAMWITGVPGSGKTTLAYEAAGRLAARGTDVAVVEWVRFVRFVTPCGPSCPRDDDVVARTLLAAAVLLTDQGVPVLIDATAPARRAREIARERIAAFAEVQLACDPDTAARRDRAVRWRLAPCARAPMPADRPEVVIGYEPALNPELTLRTDVVDVPSAAAAVVALAERLQARTRRVGVGIDDCS